jgi:hypothetical protein
MSIKVGNFDLNLYALQTRQALEAYQKNRSETSEPLPGMSRLPSELQPISPEDLPGILSDEERQTLAEAFGGNVTRDLGFQRRTSALIMKGSRIDLTL